MKKIFLFTCLAWVCIAPVAMANTVLIRTSLGDITVNLFEDEAPASVDNFLTYIREDDYRQSIVHRTVPGFIIQGGGFTILNDAVGPSVRTRAAVANEFGRSNTRGTLAYALQGSNINSATSQWFINLVDNSESLDPQQFTVFGEVIEGMEVVDAIGALDRVNAGGVFAELPVRDFDQGGNIADENVIYTEVFEISEEFIFNPGVAGVWFNRATDGQGLYFDVDPVNNIFAAAWFTFDINPPSADELEGFGSKQQRWFAATGSIESNIIDVDFQTPAGGIFNDPAMVDLGPISGTATIRFINCFSAEMSFSMDSPDGMITDTIPLSRITPAPNCLESQLIPSRAGSLVE